MGNTCCMGNTCGLQRHWGSTKTWHQFSTSAHNRQIAAPRPTTRAPRLRSPAPQGAFTGPTPPGPLREETAGAVKGKANNGTVLPSTQPQNPIRERGLGKTWAKRQRFLGGKRESDRDQQC